MNKGPNYRIGRKHEIIKILYQTCIIPYSSLPVIDGQNKMIKRAVNELTKEGIVVVDKKGGEKNIRLQDRRTHKEKYEEYIEKACIKNYESQINGVQSRLSSNNGSDAKKVIKDASSQIMMYASGITMAYQAKAETEETERAEKENKENKESIYYTSNEYKSLEMGKKNQSSRISGVLFSEGGVYPTYHVGNKLITWKQNEERKIATSVNITGKKKGYIQDSVDSISKKECIILANTLAPYVRMSRLDYGHKTKVINQTKLINIDYTYDSMYAVPDAPIGKELIKIMTQRNWKQRIYDSLLTETEKQHAKKTSVACDGYNQDENVYKYVFCVPDLVRLKQFLNRAGVENDKKRFKVYCYDFQLPIVYGIIEEDNVTVMKMSLQSYKSKVFPEIT